MFSVAFGTNVSTPLLLAYQTSLDLSTWTVTALFAVYPIGLLPALLWSGPASDALGRRRLTLPSLLASGTASLLFIPGASSLPMLFAGRLLLGAVSGVAFVVLSAWMQEITEPSRREWTARVTGMILYSGFGLGPLTGGILGQWGPAPLAVPYLVHVAIVAVAIVAVRPVPETVTAVPTGPIRPDLGLSPQTRGTFWRIVAPTALGVFGFASLAFSLLPVLLRPVMAEVAVFVTGVVAAVTAAAIFATQTLSVRLGALRAAPVALGSGTVGCAVGAVAFATGWWPLLFPAAVALGGGSGLAVTSGLRFVDVLAEPSRRGAMTGAFYGVAYAGMTMPVVVASVAGPGGFGLVLTVLTAVAGIGTVLLGRAVTTSEILSP
ncbi:MAG: MFS transporter [Acidimicrobiia bacterium]|nr:MFS transporter [Acidimicrobiia bacterium]